MPMSFAGYVAPSRKATLIFCAPMTTCAFVTITPSSRMTNPEPSPGVTSVRAPPPPPKNMSKGDAATRCTTSVCTVTTAGDTLATASVIAV